MGMMVGQKSKTKKVDKQPEANPNGQIQMVTQEQALLQLLGNIQRQQQVLGGKLDAIFAKLNE